MKDSKKIFKKRSQNEIETSKSKDKTKFSGMKKIKPTVKYEEDDRSKMVIETENYSLNQDKTESKYATNSENNDESEEFENYYKDSSSSESESRTKKNENDVLYDHSDDEESDNKKPIDNGEVESLEALLDDENQNKDLLDLPCRNSEQKKIEDYIKQGLSTTGNYSSLYISGMPGTGKTASVLASLQKLRKLSDKNHLNKFDCVIINGMKITNNNNVYKQIYNHIFNDNMKSNSNNKCCNMLDTFFKNREYYYMKNDLRKPHNPHLILIIDEIDCLVSKKMGLLYNIFNWTTYPQGKLIIISISNTIDLPQKTLSKVSSRMGSNQIAFKPYQKQELETILETTLEYKHLFTKDALSFCCSKVASISGDIRRILNICKAALSNLSKKMNTNLNNLKKHKGLIAIEEIKKASSELYDNKLGKVISGLKQYEKLVILGISLGMNDNSRVNILTAYEKFSFCCKKIKLFDHPNFSYFQIMVYNLLKLKLVSMSEYNENFISNHVYISIYRDELVSAFHNDILLKPIVEFIAC